MRGVNHYDRYGEGIRGFGGRKKKMEERNLKLIAKVRETQRRGGNKRQRETKQERCLKPRLIVRIMKLKIEDIRGINLSNY